ncbi:hypothetical protein [Novosphingobium sp. P6W]|uniref:hypothetical protein n=1 Tax=Novosphingobium sp. P6W TaxID=1609758 RepID=UPI0013B45AF0|nr:hypothetical protein [Novosphingobium sp. P6W]
MTDNPVANPRQTRARSTAEPTVALRLERLRVMDHQDDAAVSLVRQPGLHIKGPAFRARMHSIVLDVPGELTRVDNHIVAAVVHFAMRVSEVEFLTAPELRTDIGEEPMLKDVLKRS